MPPELTELLAGTSIFIVLAICGGTVVTIVFTIGITWFAIRLVRKAVWPDRTVLEQGIPAQAKIVGVQQTGVLVNHQPQIVFELEVQPPGGAPYRAQAKAVVPMVHIPQLQPGAEVPVKIHPADPTKVVLDLYK